MAQPIEPGSETSPLTPVRTAALLRSALAAITAEGAGVPAEAHRWRPAPGEWCLNEVLGHLIESEHRGFAGRIRIILAGDSPVLESWDQEEVARARGDHERSWDDLLAEFTRVRQDSIALTETLRDQDLGRGGQHPDVGFLRVSDLLHEWVHHDRNHLRQMLANVQALAWPHMGNARRFSER